MIAPSESYKALCLTPEVKTKLGRPYAAGQKCIYKNDPREICTVQLSGQVETYINLEGDGGAKVKTSDLTWIPTVAEIQKHFGLYLPGTQAQYKNFINGIDPDKYGYSCAELDRYPSEEERWLLFGMWQSSKQKFYGGKWIQINRQ